MIFLLVVVLRSKPVPAGFFERSSLTRSSAALVYLSLAVVKQTSVTACEEPLSSLFLPSFEELITFAKERGKTP